MKRFPFRIMFLCVFLPPLFYALTLQLLASYLQGRETSTLNHILIKNPEALLQGRYTVKEEIARNIREYLKGSIKYRLGIRTSILVKTADDRVLYPTGLGGSLQGDASESGTHSERPDQEPANYMEVASENFRILNDGLVLSLEIQIRHNTWLSNAILLFYVLLSLLVLKRAITRRLRESDAADEEQRRFLDVVTGELERAEARLREVGLKEAEYRQRINELNADKAELSRDVDGLLEEVEKQEAGLRSQRELREGMEAEVLRLREDLDRVKGKFARPKQKKKKSEAVERRFRVLYKNLLFTDKAVEGFLALTEEVQLKAEEMIHRLNEDESLVTVRRKVFGKGGKMDVLEAEFAYSGRLYFQKDSQTRKTRIVAVGTKNTQEKDLAYLEGMK